MSAPVSNFKSSYKTFSFEPLHVTLNRTPVGGTEISIPVEDLDLNQTFTSNWNPQDAYGRMDPIATFKNTRRSIQVKFSCRAHHIIDGAGGVVNNVRNINVLTQLLYPSYYETGWTLGGDPLAVLGAPPFFRIRYGNYVGSYNPTGEIEGMLMSGLTGYITNFTHGLGKVARNVAFGKQGKDKAYRALPRQIDVGFTFQVVHDKLVGWYQNRFSPNGYGSNFPYNAGGFGYATTDARSEDTPAAVTIGTTTSTAGGPQNAEQRAADPYSPQQQVKAAQTGTNLSQIPTSMDSTEPTTTVAPAQTADAWVPKEK